ncbi:transcriptional regulator TyrR [Brumicola nitratireducens]|uniref:HTH-type transcriptional regulatory protein TyrR n=1 Tax=Glaciecola nitratireducens (strain JCM 12485 / KCTC 12276 / FR1064) TaxID=1085623 RepID=G4QLS2_GLANF|nr:transcriptional regulator TyrR [Glaciecola nitratireducens]AEP30412.1 Transcriptional regulatory protein tyrR [Glaciecola nitratireducens FR1064]
MRLEINCQDRLGITQDVLDILTEYDIDLRGIEIDETGKIFLDFPTIEFENFQHLMPKIRRIEGITDVKTTPFMPIQRERNQLRALLQTLPDPCFSTDTSGKIILFNESVASGLELQAEQILQLNIDEVLSGFNITKWLEGKEIYAQTHRVKFIEQDYIADILPVDVPDNDKTVLAGAVVILKSESRLGQQLNVFNKTTSNCFDSFQATSAAMKKVVRDAKRMSELDGHMLIYGESGTGKQSIARACHDSSPRAEGAYQILNCASLPDDVAETELFGIEHGQFNGSDSKPGLIELSSGGTLVLDEISEMSQQLQSKLLRVIEDGHYRKAGQTETVKVDLRIICTTCKDLSESVEIGTFREDLYYRLNVLALVLPPLRERKADVIPLAENIVRQHSNKLGIRSPKLSKSCVDYLQAYPWPGNVRQLKNALYRAIALMDGNEITKEAIQLPSCSTTVNYIDENFEGTLEHEVKKFEKDLLKRLYPSYPSTRQLARKLGLSHTAIANKLREYGISKATVKY